MIVTKDREDKKIKIMDLTTLDNDIDEDVQKYLYCDDNELEESIDGNVISEQHYIRERTKNNKIRKKKILINSSLAAMGTAALLGLSKFSYNQLIGNKYYSDKLEELQDESNISFYETSNGWYAYVNGYIENGETAFKELKKYAKNKNMSDKELLMGMISYYGFDHPRFSDVISEDLSILEKIDMRNDGYEKTKKRR